MHNLTQQSQKDRENRMESNAFQGSRKKIDSRYNQMCCKGQQRKQLQVEMEVKKHERDTKARVEVSVIASATILE